MNLLNDSRQLSVFGHSNRQVRRKARLRDVQYLPAVNGLETRTMSSSIPTATALSASTTAAAYGRPVEFTATVTADGASKTKPTGAVQFEIDGASYGKPVRSVAARPASATRRFPRLAYHHGRLRAGHQHVRRQHLDQPQGDDLRRRDHHRGVVFGESVQLWSARDVHGHRGQCERPRRQHAHGERPVQDRWRRVRQARDLEQGHGRDQRCGAGRRVAHHRRDVRPLHRDFSTSTAKTVKQAVNADATTTSLAVSAATLSGSGITGLSASAAGAGLGRALRGVSVTLTATVANASAHGAGTPTGTVQFQLNGSPLGAPETLSGGQASLTIAPFVRGQPDGDGGVYQ